MHHASAMKKKKKTAEHNLTAELILTQESILHSHSALCLRCKVSESFSREWSSVANQSREKAAQINCKSQQRMMHSNSASHLCCKLYSVKNSSTDLLSISSDHIRENQQHSLTEPLHQIMIHSHSASDLCCKAQHTAAAQLHCMSGSPAEDCTLCTLHPW